MAPHVRVEQENGNAIVTLNDDDLLVFKKYDGFYGLYWEADPTFAPSEFLDTVVKLVENYSETLPSDPAVPESGDAISGGILSQEYTNDVKISEPEMNAIFSLSRESQTNSTTYEDIMFDSIRDYKRTSETTFFRINTDYFDTTWEDEKEPQESMNGTHRIAFLSHLPPMDSVVGYCLTSAEAADSDWSLQTAQDVKDALGTLTNGYGEQ